MANKAKLVRATINRLGRNASISSIMKFVKDNYGIQVTYQDVAVNKRLCQMSAEQRREERLKYSLVSAARYLGVDKCVDFLMSISY